MRGRDGERLLHKAIGLVTVSIRTTVRIAILAVNAVTVRGFVVIAAAAFTFHLPVGEKAAGNPAGTPGLAVGPSSHTGLALVPDKDRAGFNGLAFFFRKAPLNPWQQAHSACFEQNDGIGGRTHMAMVRLHPVARRGGTANRDTGTDPNQCLISRCTLICDNLISCDGRWVRDDKNNQRPDAIRGEIDPG